MDTENEDSSDGGEYESSNSEKEELLEAMAESLENQIQADLYSYQGHIDLINVLKQIGDFERVRTARNRMAENFPLSSDIWLEWLEDEIKIAVTDNEKKMVLELFDRALKDYLSVEIWLKYLEFAKDMYGYETESSVNEVRKICEQALASAGLHVTKASLLWNFFIEYEKGGLEKFQNNLDLHLNQLKLVGNLYKRMMSCPLIDIDEVYKKFTTWLDNQKDNKDKIIDKNVVENLYKASKEKVNKIRDFEDALAYDSINSARHYKAYIEHEKSKSGSPVRVQYLYERMICDFCLDEELWLEYIDFVISVLKNDDLLMDVTRRSLRHCPWSSHLHQINIQSLEKFHHSHREVRGAFEEAVSSGVQSPENFRDVWMTYLIYLRRRYDAPEISKEEENKRLDELRMAFERALQFLSQWNNADPEFMIAQFWARIEANHCRNMEKCRSLWNQILSAQEFKKADMWLEYINIERAFGDSKHLRKLLVRALQNTHDFPEKIAKYWVNYERDLGTIESYEDCLEKIKVKLNQVKEQRQRQEARKLAEKELLKRRARHLELMPKRGDAASEKAPESDPNKGQGLKRKYETSDNKDGSPEKKNKKEEQEENVQKILEETVKKSHGVTVAHDSSKDNRTVFVSNLGFSTDESLIRAAFESCGKITDLRLVKDYKGRSKGYCYVEFENANGALEALKKDRNILNGRPMFVSKCDPDSETRGKVFKYSSGMEKNKLFIRGLPFDVTEDDLRKLYGKYGALKGVRLVTYRNGHSKGLAYVDFQEEASAAKALLETHGMVIKDRTISVVISNPPERSEGGKFARPFARPHEPGPRKTGRKQLSFVPRSVQLRTPPTATETLGNLSLQSPQATESVSPQATESVSPQATESVSPQATESQSSQPKQLSNSDFRSMLN